MTLVHIEGNIKAIIVELRTAGIRLSLTGSQLEVFFPDGNIDDAIVAKLRAHKAAIIAYLQKESGLSDDHIPQATPAAAYPLSSSQKRLWILNQLGQGGAAYNMPAVYFFEGKLDMAALQYAFHAVIERHEILRTVFREDIDGEVRQVILPAAHINFNIPEYTTDSPDAAIAADALTPFDLATGPLIRATLYKTGTERWMFSYVMHHIISDGWSMGILIQELFTCYQAAIQQVPHTLPPLRIQYKDYAQWQQTLDTTDRDHWKGVFGDGVPVLTMSSDQPRPPVKTYNGSVVLRHIPAATTTAFKLLCQQEQASLFMGLLAAVNALLYRYTGQEDLCIGTPIAGREHPELEGQIGFYVNTLVLRNRFDGQQDFVQLLRQVRETTLQAYKHQSYPFDELLEVLPLQRDISRNPLFDVFISLQDNVLDLAAGTAAAGLTVRPYEQETRICKFDLTFDFTETAEGLAFSLGYNTDIFPAHFAAQLSLHFEQLLAAVTASPLTPVSHQQYLSAAELSSLAADTHVPAVEDAPVVASFEGQAAETPDQVALVCGDSALTYRELNERANQFAHYLSTQRGVQAKDLVGIQLERSEWLIIAMIAVWKSGAAYVPIDPGYPQERIAYLLEDSRCKVLIDEGILAAFKEQAGNYPVVNPAHMIDGDDPCYVIYTSGSTGKPKGVLIRHRSLALFAANCQRVYSNGTGVVMPLLASVSFDISLFELLLPLLSGGTSLLLRNNEIKDTALLAKQLQSATAIHAVPALMAQLLAEIKAGGLQFPVLRDLFIGGDAVPGAVLQEMRDVFPHVTINVLYGPTESTIFVTSNHYLPGLDTPFNGACLGRPAPHVRVVIVDSHGQLTPPGVPGEICIGGDTVAAGYLHQPALTAEKFVDGLYHTGDLGKWYADGTIGYCGRADNQVKIRGFRIEPAEIENAMQGFPGIAGCAVIDITGKQGDRELVMYLAANEAVNAVAVRKQLAAQLPAYMIPENILWLPQLPLTPNGKVDKNALRHAAGLATISDTPYEAPENELEEQLVQVWETLLAKTNIGVRDNFFEIGGTSIKIVKLSRLISQTLGKEVSVTTLFQYPTIRELAATLGSELVTATIADDFDRDQLLSDLNKFN